MEDMGAYSHYKDCNESDLASSALSGLDAYAENAMYGAITGVATFGVFKGGSSLLKGPLSRLAMSSGGAARTGAGAAEQGGLNLFKWKHPTSTRATGWKKGDRFLYLPNQGSSQANWAQNSSRLRAEMRSGEPSYETFVDDVGNLLPTRGFLNAERNLLMNRGWTYHPSTRAWTPPTP
jgi:hypothetical protein